MIKEEILKNSNLNEEKEDDLKKSYTLTLKKGDAILVGKFRNRKAKIKGFSFDDKDQPVVHTTKGKRKMVGFRLTDEEESEKEE